MDRIDTPGHVNRLWSAGNAAASVPGTVLGQVFMNDLQEELVTMIEEAGLTPTKNRQDQVRQAIEILCGLDAAQREGIAAATLRNSGLIVPATERRGVQTWIARQGEAEGWQAGRTTEAPYQGTTTGGSGGTGSDPDDNTYSLNEYETGLEAGEDWPFMVPSSVMKKSGAGFYPACFYGTGINHYRRGLWIPPAALINGGRIELVLSGIYTSTEGSRTLEFDFGFDRTPGASWNPLRDVGFQVDGVAITSEAYWVARCLIHGGGRQGTNWDVVFLWDFLFGTGGLTAPAHDQRRMTYLPLPSATFDMLNKGHWLNVRYKTDAAGTIGSYQGGNQGGTYSRLTCLSYTVNYQPGQD